MESRIITELSAAADGNFNDLPDLLRRTIAAYNAISAERDKIAKAALDLIDEADLTCHRKNEEIPVGECPCAVCVLQGLAPSGGTVT